MKFYSILLLSVLVTSSAAQDVLGSLLSDGLSLVQSVTSVLGAASTSASSSRPTTTSRSSASSTSSSTASSSATPSSTSSSSTASETAAQASATAAAATNNNGGGGGSNLLPIVLGATLGALALAAFLALLFLCRRRRNRRHSALAIKHRPLSSDEDETESWRHEKPRISSFKGPMTTTNSANNNTYVPLARRNGHDVYGQNHHDNPFVPTSAALGHGQGVNNFADTTEYSAHPYSPDNVYGHGSTVPYGPHTSVHGSHSNVTAAGVGGASLGALAAHAVSRKERSRSRSHTRNPELEHQDSAYGASDYQGVPQSATPHRRRSSSLGRASTKELWPFAAQQGRKSGESTRSRKRSQSYSRDNFSTPDPYPHDAMPLNHHGMGMTGAAAVGGLAGAAAARKSGSRSPHRRGILKSSTPERSDSTMPRNAPSYAATTRHPNHTNAGPHELDSSDSTLPQIVQNASDTSRTSPAGNHATNDLAIGSDMHSHSGSDSDNLDRGRLAPLAIPRTPPNEQHPPHMPSRSPRRSSLNPNARYSLDNQGTVELPVEAPQRETISPPLEAQRTSEPDAEGVFSPVSPITTSNPGTWSKSQAEELGFATGAGAAATGKHDGQPQDNAIVNVTEKAGSASSSSPSPDNEHQNSSGLVSAIQRIFSSQKSAWAADDEERNPDQTRRHKASTSLPTVASAYHEDASPITSVPHRKPAPQRASYQPFSQYGEVAGANPYTETQPYNNPGTAVHDFQEAPSFQQFAAERRSDETKRRSGETRQRSQESARRLPPGSFNAYTQPPIDIATANPTDNIYTPPAQPPPIPQPVNVTNTAITGATRSQSRPGYGLNSGDPYDLARTRSDSNMTGLSLANYQDASSVPHPSQQQQDQLTSREASPPPEVTPIPRPKYKRSSSSSSTDRGYREPTLAELRAEVAAEDRQRARAKEARRSQEADRRRRRSSAHSASSGRGMSSGLRYGDDKELFDLVEASVGVNGWKSGEETNRYDRFYGQHSSKQESGQWLGRAL